MNTNHTQKFEQNHLAENYQKMLQLSQSCQSIRHGLHMQVSIRTVDISEKSSFIPWMLAGSHHAKKKNENKKCFISTEANFKRNSRLRVTLSSTIHTHSQCNNCQIFHSKAKKRVFVFVNFPFSLSVRLLVTGVKSIKIKPEEFLAGLRPFTQTPSNK